MKPEITNLNPQNVRKTPQPIKDNDTLFYVPAPIDIGKVFVQGAGVLAVGGVFVLVGGGLVIARAITFVFRWSFFGLYKVFYLADNLSGDWLSGFLSKVLDAKEVQIDMRPDADAGQITHVQKNVFNINNGGGNIHINNN